MKLTYDPRADAAYLLMGEPLVRGQVASTYLCDPSEIDGMINLDFDKEGRLLGIEILDASIEASCMPLPSGWAYFTTGIV